MQNESRDEPGFWQDEEWPEQQEQAEPARIEDELPGSVYMVPDELWQIHAWDRSDHPGACANCDIAMRNAWLCKGTDPASARTDRYNVLMVEPSSANGLQKTTAFGLDPRPFRLHKIVLMHQSPRRLGRLEAHEIQVLQASLIRKFPGAGSPR